MKDNSNTFPNKPSVLRVCHASLESTDRVEGIAVAIFPIATVLSTYLMNFLPFSSNLKLFSADSFSLEKSKICRLVKGLIFLATLFVCKCC